MLAGHLRPPLNIVKILRNYVDNSTEGVFVIGLSFPVVARGKARIRVQISAAHTEADIDRTVAAFVKVGRELGVVS